MGSFRCPYLVRHGKFVKKLNSIVFEDQCALKIKAYTPTTEKIKTKAPKVTKLTGPSFPISCAKHPLEKNNGYLDCKTYQNSFITLEEKRDVVPTKDLEYASKLKTSSLLDLEML